MKDTMLLVIGDGDETRALVLEDAREFESSQYASLLEQWMSKARIAIDISADDGEWPEAIVTKWEGLAKYD